MSEKRRVKSRSDRTPHDAIVGFLSLPAPLSEIILAFFTRPDRQCTSGNHTIFQALFIISMSSKIILQPRPFAQVSGRLLLLPLLPHKRPLKPLPSEIWWKIAGEVLGTTGTDNEQANTTPNSARLALLTVCKGLNVRITMSFCCSLD